MKLYTEAQLRKVIQMADKLNYYDVSVENGIISLLTPIQLLNDDDINSEAKKKFTNWKNIIAFEDGAKWMRDKIQGGNQ